MHARVLIVLFASAARLSLALSAVGLRNVKNFSDMIKVMTGKDSLDFYGYGNWCGKGGQGKPVDELDRCCFDHDKCYDRIMLHKCKGLQNMKVYLTTYRWSVKNKQVVCHTQEDECANVLCKCDRQAVTCFAKSKYNPANNH